MFRRMGIIAIALFLLSTVFQLRTAAQGYSGLESRLSNLEGDVRQLRAQMSRLESQATSITPPYPAPARSAPIPTPSRDRNRGNYSSDPMFDRLATLVVELKQRVSQLEQQVGDLRKLRTTR